MRRVAIPFLSAFTSKAALAGSSLHVTRTPTRISCSGSLTRSGRCDSNTNPNVFFARRRSTCHRIFARRVGSATLSSRTSSSLRIDYSLVKIGVAICPMGKRPPGMDPARLGQRVQVVCFSIPRNRCRVQPHLGVGVRRPTTSSTVYGQRYPQFTASAAPGGFAGFGNLSRPPPSVPGPERLVSSVAGLQPGPRGSSSHEGTTETPFPGGRQ